VFGFFFITFRRDARCAFDPLIALRGAK